MTDRTAADYVPTEGETIEAFQPIRYFALAAGLQHLVASGLFDHLLEHGPCPLPALAESFGFDPRRLEEFLKYLRNEGYIRQDGRRYGLSAKGEAFRHHRHLYTFMIGGYAQTFMEMGDKLRQGSGPAGRDWTQISIGSSSNARYDTPPVLRRLLAHAPVRRFRLLDIGCGNGSYLVDLCRAMPEIEQAYGYDTSHESCLAARALIAAQGLTDRIRIIHGSSAEGLGQDRAAQPNLLVLGYVLHELLFDRDRDGVKAFITQFFERFPDLNLIVLEIDDQRDAPEFLEHAYGLAFYNPYFLLHGFIDQRVMPAAFWEQLFADCGLEILARESIDSSGWLPCYLLRRAEP